MILLPYQREAVNGIEKKRFSVLLWARQTGKSFTMSYYAIKRCLSFDNHRVVVISPSERQSKELLDKVKFHVQALKLAGVTYFEDVETFQLEARFPNNSKIIALPSKPETVRGFTGDVIMDECAFFEKGFEVYSAVFPTITRNPRYKLIAISTPKTKKDLFYFLWQTAENDPEHWFKYKLTIYEAVEKGLEIDPEELKAGLKNPDAWKREYLCEFIEDDEVLLPYEIIQACEEEGIEVKDLRELKGEVFIGVDIARRHDLTVVSVVEKLGSVFYLRKLEVLKNMPFSKQFAIIDHYSYFASKIAIDETGIGMQMAEDLKAKWGDLKVIPVYFTAKVKEELASRLKAKFEDKLIRIPPDHDLREDLHSVRKVVTDTGRIKLEGGTEDGHADRFWSLALAVYAGSQEETPTPSPLVFTNYKLAKLKLHLLRWRFPKWI
jgi:phage FluMu gp28-like protein